MSSTTFPVNRLAMMVLVTLAIHIGMIPYALFLGLEFYLPLAALIVVPSAWSEIKKSECWASEAPSLGEMLLGGWAATSNGAITSLIGLTTYFLVWLVGYVFGWEVGSVAFWCSLAVAAPFAFGASLTAAEELPAKLYPGSAGSSSVFYSLLAQRRRLLFMVTASVVVLSFLLWFFDPHGWVLAALLVTFLVATTMPLDGLEHGQGGSPGKAKAIEAISKALEYAGFSVILAPRTGRQDIDPLVATVDLLAQKDKRALAIEVKAGAHRSKPVEWREAATLRMGARALQQAIKDEDTDEGALVVSPMMVLVDRDRSESFDSFLKDGDLIVRELPLRLFQDTGKEGSEAELARLLLSDRPPALREAGEA